MAFGDHFLVPGRRAGSGFLFLFAWRCVSRSEPEERFLFSARRRRGERISEPFLLSPEDFLLVEQFLLFLGG